MTMLAPKTVDLGAGRVGYAVKYTTGARRARIRVGPAGVVVVLPRKAPEARAEELLREHAEWVRGQLRFVQRAGSLRHPASSYPTLLLRGERLRVRVVTDEGLSRHVRVARAGEELLVRTPRAGGRPDRAVESWLRREARADIGARMAERSCEMRCRPNRLFVMGQRTKWGNCSARRNISVNWRLVMAPPAALDYIVVHELAHLIEPYHSPRFWLVVMSHCADYQSHRAWLKAHGHRLLRASTTLG
jgi:predicted metal-dependent hydrolase